MEQSLYPVLLKTHKNTTGKGRTLPTNQEWQNTLVSGRRESAGEHCKKASAGPH